MINDYLKEKGGFCLLVELNREGSAINGATPSIFCMNAVSGTFHFFLICIFLGVYRAHVYLYMCSYVSLYVLPNIYVRSYTCTALLSRIEPGFQSKLKI